ncbi:MAG: HNH endonuclease [Rhodothermales bacterium]|nr:HNH endonuclease [Rhodothermales bacterium]
MNGHVLVLNRDYSALSICSVKRAVVMLHLQKVELVEALGNRAIRSATVRHPWPSIVRLSLYIKVPYRRIMLTRKNVIRRDGFRCQYCGSRDKLTIDHVIPKSRGGRDIWENLVAACVPCNNRKGNHTPDEARLELRRRPFRPSHVMFIRDYVETFDDGWKPYLFLS